nr:protein FAM8A1-like isoform X1 [Lytechinus pictus]
MAEESPSASVRKRNSSAAATPTENPISSASSSSQSQQEQDQIPGENHEFLRHHRCSSMAEYYERLRRWLFMYRSHMYMQQHMMLMMPYMTFASFLQQQSAGTGTTASQTSAGVTREQPLNNARQQQQLGGRIHGQNQQIQNDIRAAHGVQNQQNVTQAGNNIPQIAVLDFSVPSIYRRVFAEVIDFFLLFSAKLGLMLIIIDYLGISSDTTGFMMRFLVEEIEEDTSLEELQQMLLFAFIYRIIVCIYETFFLCSSVNRILGGATPGKFFMRLRVISLEQVQSAGPGRVQVTLPDSVGFTQALLRSLVKNFSMAFFFPACITVFFNPHFRAAYEVLTKTMVVGTENWPLTFQQRGQIQGVIR